MSILYFFYNLKLYSEVHSLQFYAIVFLIFFKYLRTVRIFFWCQYDYEDVCMCNTAYE